MHTELRLGIPGTVMIDEFMNYEDGWKSLEFCDNTWTLYTATPNLSSRDAFVSQMGGLEEDLGDFIVNISKSSWERRCLSVETINQTAVTIFECSYECTYSEYRL